MKELEEQHLCVKFCCKRGKNFKEIFQLQDAIVTVDGQRVSSTKKSTDELVKDQGLVGCVF